MRIIEPREEYDRAAGMRWSSLKHIATSPAAFQWNLHADRVETSAMRLGTLVHRAVLEPQLWGDYTMVYGGDSRRGKEWSEFTAEWGSTHEIVTASELRTVNAIRDAIRRHPAAGALLAEPGDSELSLYGHIMGVSCKARADRITNSGRLLELKTTGGSVSPRAFSRVCHDYQYHGQVAMYCDLAELQLATIIAVSTRAPHDVAVYTVTADVMELGRALVSECLEAYNTCMESGQWGCAYPLPMELTYPSWVYGSEGDALEGCE